MRQRADEFDILHFHVDILHFPIFQTLKERVIVSAVKKAATLDRSVVRERFRRRFTAERMAQDYFAVYELALEQSRHSRAQRASGACPKEGAPYARPLAVGLPAALRTDASG